MMLLPFYGHILVIICIYLELHMTKVYVHNVVRIVAFSTKKSIEFPY